VTYGASEVHEARGGWSGDIGAVGRLHAPQDGTGGVGGRVTGIVAYLGGQQLAGGLSGQPARPWLAEGLPGGPGFVAGERGQLSGHDLGNAAGEETKGESRVLGPDRMGWIVVHGGSTVLGGDKVGHVKFGMVEFDGPLDCKICADWYYVGHDSTHSFRLVRSCLLAGAIASLYPSLICSGNNPSPTNHVTQLRKLPCSSRSSRDEQEYMALMASSHAP
jgi:hypothetical protein